MFGRTFTTLVALSLVVAGASCGSEVDNALVHACLKRAACNVKGYPAVKHCIDRYVNLDLAAGLGPIYNDILQCAAEASDCAGVKACFGVGGSCDKSYKATCSAGKATFCDLIEHVTYSLDCAKHGQTCKIKPAGGYAFDATCTGGGSGGESLSTGVDCGDGTCEKTGKSCTPNDDFDRCAGDRLESCIDGEWVSFDCTKLNMEACMQQTGGYACAGY
jgi:hypothetical protein